MTLSKALELARAGRAQAERDFLEFLAIPSVSSLSRHRADTRRAGQWLVDRLLRLGFEVRFIDVTEHGHPVIDARWLGRPGQPTLAIYGHYDVQPPDPLDEWITPPFEPTVRGGNVYARGACDNKGQVFADLVAVEHAFAAGGPPLNLRFLVEGEEEISGTSLPTHLRDNARDLASDYVLIADGEFTAPGVPNIITGLRGLLYTEIVAEGAAADLHSGIFGGVAPNPLNTLAHVIAALKGRDGHINIPGFYDAVRAPDASELAAWQTNPRDERAILDSMNAPALEGEADFTPLERTWARPTLDVHGIVGGFTDEGKKTVIAAKAKAKVSMRLVPAQDPADILERLRAFVATMESTAVRLRVDDLGQAPPVLSDVDHPGIDAARAAFVSAWGAEPVFQREGGSVPVTIDFQESLRPRLIITGYGLPDDALHSPNEKMSLEQFHLGAEFVLHLMHNLASK